MAVGGPTMVAASKNAHGAINSLRHPSDQGDIDFSEIRSLPSSSLLFFLIQTPKKTQKHSTKTHQSLLILPSSLRTQGIAFALNLLFLGSTSWIWGLGVWM